MIFPLHLASGTPPQGGPGVGWGWAISSSNRFRANGYLFNLFDFFFIYLLSKSIYNYSFFNLNKYAVHRLHALYAEGHYDLGRAPRDRYAQSCSWSGDSSVFTLLTSLTTSLAAALFSVTTGALQFAAVKGKDIFLNESEAVAYLKANYQLKNATYVHVLCSPTPPIIAGSPTLEPMIPILFIITTHVFYICSLFIY